MRRSTVTVAATGLLCLLTALGGAASASVATATATPAAGGIKGSPQPEIKTFKIGASNYPGGSIAMEPDGTLVTARLLSSSSGLHKAVICVLARGATKCASSATLSTLSGYSVTGTPQVLIPAANHVVVLLTATGDGNAAGGDLFFSSVNGGKSFAAPVRVGSLPASDAALIGGQIVFSARLDEAGTEVASVAIGAPAPPAAVAVAAKVVPDEVVVGSYRRGALIASTTASNVTYVEYAAAGANFNASASYHRVAALKHEEVIDMSGNVLLTSETNGKKALVLRVFANGTFGPAHVVPGTAGSESQLFAVDRDPSGAIHVFSHQVSEFASYALYEVTTTTLGRTWASPRALGDAINSDSFTAVIDSTGAGLVLGTGGNTPAYGFPVLAGQSTSFRLKSATIKKGGATSASGVARPAAKGRVVQLQVQRKGLWYAVATARENRVGHFSFTIKNAATGTYRYRAVVADQAGYRLYGYSATRTLVVKG